MSTFLRISFSFTLASPTEARKCGLAEESKVKTLANNACASSEAWGLVQFRERQRIAPFLEILSKEKRAFGHIESRANHLSGKWMFLRGDPKLVLLTWV